MCGFGRSRIVVSSDLNERPMTISSCTSLPLTSLETDRPSSGPALERVFDRCASSLFRFFVVRTGGDEHLADDLMQQLWLQARGSRRSVPENELEYWLRAIARNLVRAHWRRIGQRPNHLSLGDPALAADLGRRMASEVIPDDVMHRAEVRQQLMLALTELSHDDQTILIAHYFHGKPHAELASLLGLTHRAVEGRLYRARRSLRTRLEALEP